jgi:transaldolase
VAGGTQLESLACLSKIVRNSVVIEPDEGESFKDLKSCSSAAAVTSRVLLKVLRSPVGMRQYKQSIESALAYVDKTKNQTKEQLEQCSLNQAMVNLGALLVDQVDGRVSMEVDARFSHSTDKIVDQVLHLSQLYEEVGVSKDRVLYRIPATWHGIQAAKVLEQKGLNTLMTLVCSFAQCVAAAEAGVSVVQLYVGRVRDWYKAHPNAIRDPNGPREDAGYEASADPGVQLVTKCYNYLHKYHPKTKIMAGDIRSKKDALQLAGCDFIVLPPQIIKELNSTPSSLGYNDGLSATSGYPSDVQVTLSEAKAAASEFSEKSVKGFTDEKAFQEGLGDCGQELLTKSLKRYCDSINQLEPYFTKIALK